MTSYAYGAPGPDGAALPVLVTMKDPGGAVTGTIKLAYGPDGKLQRRDYLNPDGSLRKSELYAYQPAAPYGPVSMELLRADGSISEKTTYQSGDLGQILEATDSDGSGAIRGVTKYEYIVRDDTHTNVYYE